MASESNVTQEQVDAIYTILKNLQYINGNATGNKPSCSNDIYDSGDTAFMLASTALVLFMTLPGFDFAVFCDLFRHT